MAQAFTERPPRTGAVQLDAAFAAVADHLAERDGWQAPAWTVAGPGMRARGFT
ncbi:hypothetical protein MF406_00050 [Georgenia sp. TF02-10]|uniref:hypothetical protein n=1 Tax=Georgenia sp. TF02-10 TaxID=2917725 RepID=UPI001FA6EE66|nr:hypothetical protein [Georgenia sp. TF02-10]UNX54742.1 hypothetical protein MF406_00050 [Georgenia sp. TF02-10]